MSRFEIKYTTVDDSSRLGFASLIDLHTKAQARVLMFNYTVSVELDNFNHVCHSSF